MNLSVLLRACLALVAMQFAAAVAAQDGGELKLVPHPDPASMPAEVREALEPAVARFQDERARLQDEQLGLAYGRMALNYHAFGFLEAAEASYANAAALDSGNVRWPYLLGVLLLDQQRHGEALEALQTSLRLDPRYAPAYARLGRALLGLGRHEEARKAFDTALTGGKENAYALAGLAEAALAGGEPVEAAGLFRRALDAEPDATALRSRLAQALKQAGDEEAAGRERARAGQGEPELADPLVSFMQAHRTGAEPYMGRARDAAQAGRWDEAVDLLELAVSIDPELVPAFTALGDARARVGNLPGAAAALQQAVKIAPDDFTAHYLLGTVMERAGRDLEAEGAYRRALEIDPVKVEPRVLLANALMRRREYAEASQHYTAVAKSLPEDAEVLTLLGLSMYAAGDCPRAQKAMGMALEAAPQDAGVAAALARIYATCPGVDETLRRQALEVAGALYQQEPTQWHAETLAMVAAANALYDDAVDFQTQAIFEALKSDADEERLATLRANLERYEAESPAAKAWPENADVFSPRRLEAPAQDGGDSG